MDSCALSIILQRLLPTLTRPFTETLLPLQISFVIPIALLGAASPSMTRGQQAHETFPQRPQSLEVKMLNVGAESTRTAAAGRALLG